MNIHNLEGVDMVRLHSAFIAAFSDYAEPYDKTLQEMMHIIERRGYDPGISFGTFDDEILAAFTLNGIDTWNGVLTAYDTGTGTIPSHRRRGLAARIFNESIPALKQRGIRQYLLEVIKVNTKAFDLYAKLGFEVVRELDYYIIAKDELSIRNEKIIDGYTTKEIADPDWEQLKAFWEFQPSWQNSIASVLRKRSLFSIMGIYDAHTLAGYGIVEKETGDIPQFAISQPYRREGLGTTLLHELLKHSDGDTVRFINAEATYEPFKFFMNSIGLKPGHGQYEMIRNL
ncbi:MAG: GCN5-Related N-Acetyltransferase [Flavipsychrobacter sp.]|nr:GCN5-Related N-Acetyltransferase [Flavipsychrobacter sp.]